MCDSCFNRAIIDKTFIISLNGPKFSILIKIAFLNNIWKGIAQALLLNRFCDKNILSFPDNLLRFFARCEALTHSFYALFYICSQHSNYTTDSRSHYSYYDIDYKPLGGLIPVALLACVSGLLATLLETVVTLCCKKYGEWKL